MAAFTLVLLAFTLLASPQRFANNKPSGQLFVAASPVEGIELDCREQAKQANRREAIRLIAPILAGVSSRAASQSTHSKRFSEPYYASDLISRLTDSMRLSDEDQSGDLINPRSSGSMGLAGFSDDLAHGRFNPMRGKRNSRLALE